MSTAGPLTVSAGKWPNLKASEDETPEPRELSILGKHTNYSEDNGEQVWVVSKWVVCILRSSWLKEQELRVRKIGRLARRLCENLSLWLTLLLFREMVSDLWQNENSKDKAEFTDLVKSNAFNWKEHTLKLSLYQNSLAVQWFGFGTFMARTQIQFLIGELRLQKLCNVAEKRKEKKNATLLFPPKLDSSFVLQNVRDNGWCAFKISLFVKIKRGQSQVTSDLCNCTILTTWGGGVFIYLLKCWVYTPCSKEELIHFWAQELAARLQIGG